MPASPNPPPVQVPVQGPPTRQVERPRQPVADSHRDELLSEISTDVHRIHINVTIIGMVFLIWMGLKLLAYLR